jgi:prephenate dehydratase
MTDMTVAHFGDEDAYAAEAASRLYPAAEMRPCRSVSDVMRAVTKSEVACGVLPIENSLAGAIPETYDLLAHAPLAIVDEVVLPVPHCLVGLSGTNIDALARIHSHPAALAQCRRFLSSLPDALPDVAPSTAAAARRVAEARDTAQAAISSRRAGERMGLTVLLNDVSDHAENYTRFVAVAPHTRIDRRDGREWRTAVRFVTHHHPGALARAINPLATFGVNMCSLQSRPIPGRPWNYQFYADLEGHPLDAPMAEALQSLEREVAELAFLGCYPAAPRP